jgi:hypothetical protein
MKNYYLSTEKRKRQTRLAFIIIFIVIAIFVGFSVIHGLIENKSGQDAWEPCEKAQESNKSSFSRTIFIVVKKEA